MEKFNIRGYEAYTNSDLTEGRGRAVHIAYFKNNEDALRAAKGKGVMGSDADTKAVDIEFIVFDTFAEYENNENAVLRKKALAKLTLAEKKALGLV